MQRWLTLLAQFAASNVTVQVVGSLAGVIWAWTLPVDQYAILSLCMGMVAMGAIFSDLGTSAAIGYFWRQVGQGAGQGVGAAPERAGDEPTRGHARAGVSAYVQASNQLRTWLAMCVSTTAAIALWWMLSRRGHSVTLTAACIGLVLVAVWAQLKNGLDTALMRLEGRIAATLASDVWGAGVRLAVAIGAAIVAAQSVLLALIAIALGALVSRNRLLAAGGGAAAYMRTPTSDGRALKDTIRYILPTVPAVVVFAFKEQIVVWLAWFTGGAAPVAEMFALGRLAVFFGLFTGFIAAIAVPKLAGITDDRKFARWSVLIIGAIAGVCCLITLAAWAFPKAALFVVGPKYGHLARELIWVLFGASINTLAHALSHINRLRGWVRLEPLLAIVMVITMGFAVKFGDFSTTLGSIWANNIIAISGLVMVVVITLAGMLGIARLEEQPKA